MEDPLPDTIDDSEEQQPITTSHVFMPPSLDSSRLLSGDSYTFYSPIPSKVFQVSTSSSTVVNEPTSCVLGVDEAGRGPVLGPMVYSAFYLPQHLHHSLLTKDYSFNDSKVLTPDVRSNLMRLICTPDHPLFDSCGWAVRVLSAQEISSGMLRPSSGVYNLNAQAMDATIELIRGIVEERSVDVKEVYIDTIGNPNTYQQKLERIFPSLKITVAKKADALYPCVSAASVAAKVTRDAALEMCYEALIKNDQKLVLGGQAESQVPVDSWGSGYPSDMKCVSWLRNDMNPIFGWGNECRFSWGTAKDLLESKEGTKVEWPVEDDNGARLTDLFVRQNTGKSEGNDELRNWYGCRGRTPF